MMKWLVCAALALGALFVPDAASAAEFKIEKGRYLWHGWAETYKAEWENCGREQNRTFTWNSFVERVAFENDFANTARFRRLKEGEVLRIPETPCAIGHKDALIQKLTVERDALQTARFQLEKAVEAANAKAQTASAELQEVRRGFESPFQGYAHFWTWLFSGYLPFWAWFFSRWTLILLLIVLFAAVAVGMSDRGFIRKRRTATASVKS